MATTRIIGVIEGLHRDYRVILGMYWDNVDLLGLYRDMGDT